MGARRGAHLRARATGLVVTGAVAALAGLVASSGATSAALGTPSASTALSIPVGTPATAAAELTATTGLLSVTSGVTARAAGTSTPRGAAAPGSATRPPTEPKAKPKPNPKPKPEGYVNPAGPAPVLVAPITLRPHAPPTRQLGPILTALAADGSLPRSPGTWTVERSIQRVVHVFDLPDSPTADSYLACAGSGNQTGRGLGGRAPRFDCYRVNRTTDTQTRVPLPDDWFCSVAVHDANGDIVTTAGTRSYPFLNDVVRGTWGGSASTYRYHADTGQIDRLGDLVSARWYPNVFKNENNDIYLHGGQNDGRSIATWEVMRNGTDTWEQLPFSRSMDSYSDMELIAPDTFAFTGATSALNSARKQPFVIDMSDFSVHAMPGLSAQASRRASGALLTYPAQDEKVLVYGGFTKDGRTATANVDSIDLSVYPDQLPSFVPAAPLPYAMGFAQMVNLPNGQIFATAGSRVWRSGDVLWAGLYDPQLGTWTLVTPPSYGRDYHSNVWVNTDGTVSVSGGNSTGKPFQDRVETYRPWYLDEERPVLAGLPAVPAGGRLPALVKGGSYPVSVTLPAGASLGYVTLDSARASTHVSSDPEQAMFDVPFTEVGGQVAVQIPDTVKLVPGAYKLTAVTTDQVPSTSTWVTVVP